MACSLLILLKCSMSTANHPQDQKVAKRDAKCKYRKRFFPSSDQFSSLSFVWSENWIRLFVSSVKKLISNHRWVFYHKIKGFYMIDPAGTNSTHTLSLSLSHSLSLMSFSSLDGRITLERDTAHALSVCLEISLRAIHLLRLLLS